MRQYFLINILQNALESETLVPNKTRLKPSVPHFVRTLIFLFLTPFSLFAEGLKVDNSMPWMIPWLVGTLILVALFFWGIYKAMKTKNAKYGYLIFFTLLLMVVALFI